MGREGFDVIADTTAHTGPYACIQCVTAVVFTALAADNSTGGTGVTFPANFTICGPINSFTLTSGTVLATRGTIA